MIFIADFFSTFVTVPFSICLFVQLFTLSVFCNSIALLLRTVCPSVIKLSLEFLQNVHYGLKVKFLFLGIRQITWLECFKRGPGRVAYPDCYSDWDPDPALDLDTDPDPDLDLDQHPDPALDLDKDPVPAQNLDQDPDPALDLDEDPAVFIMYLIKSLLLNRIRILDKYPDPALVLDQDPDS